MGKTGRFWSEDGEAAYRRTYEAARALWPVHEVRLIPCRSTTGVASPVPVVSAWTVPNCVVRRLDRRRLALHAPERVASATLLEPAATIRPAAYPGAAEASPALG